MDKLITITQSEYDRLVRRDEEYAALEAAGVDNWEGYGEAKAMMMGGVTDG